MRINLDCPFRDKDKAKSLGAKWDQANRVWYVIDPEDLTPFIPWLGKHKVSPVGKPAKGKKRGGPCVTIGKHHPQIIGQHDGPPWS